MSYSGLSITGDGKAAINKKISTIGLRDFKHIRNEDLSEVFEIERCKQWILENSYTRICIQVPDEYCEYVTQIIDLLQDLNRKIFLLADSTYGRYFVIIIVDFNSAILPCFLKCYGYEMFVPLICSCCVDEKTAQHVPDADSIIHFGSSCLSATSGRFPVLYIFTKPPLDLPTLEKVFRENFKMDENVLILYDVIYEYASGTPQLFLNDF